jgi:stage 0 sporulation regulatory protein
MYSSIKKSFLLILINKKRSKMITIGKKYGLTDKQTVLYSQQLDKLLDQYQKLNSNSKEMKSSPTISEYKASHY